MKIIKVAAIISLLASTFFMSSYKYETKDDALSDFSDILPEGEELQDGEELSKKLGIDSVLSELISAVSLGLPDAVSLFLLLLGISALAMAAASSPPFENPAFSSHISMATAAVASLLIFSRLFPMYESVKEGIESISAFFGAAVPVLTGVLYAGGELNSAASGAVGMNITLGVITCVTSKLLLPLSCAVFALALLSGIDTGSVSALAKRFKGFFMWTLGIITTVLVASFSMQSLISGASDTAYLRTAKYAASGMIPIVGSTVSSALGTLAGGLSYAKNIIGIGSVAVIGSVAILPLIKLLLFRLAFSLAISFADFLGAAAVNKTFTAFRDALDVLLSVYVMTTVVYIFEIIVLIRCGGSVF